MFERLSRVFLCIFVTLLALETLQVPVGPLDVRLHQGALIGLVAWFVGRGMYLLKTSQVSLRPAMSQSLREYALLLFIFVVFAGIGGMLHTSLAPTLTQTLVFLSMACTFFVIMYSIRSHQRMKVVLASLMVGTVLNIGFALYQALAFKFGLLDFMVFEGRVNGLLPEPNWFAIWHSGIVALLLPMTFFIPHWFLRKWQSLWWILLFLNLVVIILSLTRASWLALFVTGIVFYGILLWPARYAPSTVLKHAGKMCMLLIGAVVLIETFSLTKFSLYERAESIISHTTTHYETRDGESVSKEEAKERDDIVTKRVKDVNVASRIEDYRTSLSIASEYPLVGVGFAGYKERVGETRNTSNLFLGALVAGGFPGLIAFTLLIYRQIRDSIQYIRKKHLMVGTMMLNVTLVISISGMFNNGMLLAFIWMFLGLTAAFPFLPPEEEKPENSI